MPPPSSGLDHRDLMTLVDSGRELAGEIDLRALLKSILEKASALTDSPDTSVLLYDQERKGLYFAAATGTSAPMLLERWSESSNQRVPLTGSKAGAVFTSRQSLVERSVEADPDHYKGVDQQTRHKTTSMVCVPLAIGDESLGVMQILNKRSGNYTERDCSVLEYLAAHAAVAIRNAQLFEDLLAHMGLYTSGNAQATTSDLVKQLRTPAHSERMTLLFADMRGFTQLCQILSNPERIQEFLTEFLTMLSDQVVQYGGVVNKFMGDGLFAFFRDNDSARQAVTCAAAIVERFGSLRNKWDQGSNQVLDFLDIGIGIVTDKVIIGTVGSARMRDFTAIGTAVNLAAAFEQAARGGKRVLVDQNTYLAVMDLAEFEGPESFVLRKPDQRIGHPYKQYSLIRLKAAAPKRVLLFVSHGHRDRDFVETHVTAPLAGKGIGTWYSGADIRAGADFVKAIEEGLMKCDWMVVVVSESSVKSEWVRREVSTALSDPRLQSRIIPIVLGDTTPEKLSPLLMPLQHLVVRDASDASTVADRLHERVTADAAGAPDEPGGTTGKSRASFKRTATDAAYSAPTSKRRRTRKAPTS